MNLNRLIFKELAYRKGNFVLGVGVIVFAVLCVTGAIAVLEAFDRHTDTLIGEMEEELKQDMEKLEDSIRKSMKGLGFNIYIFPKDQDLGEVYAEGYASKTMPEDYVTTLSNSKIVTVNHLLPSLTRKLEWPEYERTVILIGVRGEVPTMHRAVKGALVDPVDAGKLVLGYELHKSLKLKVGDPVKFMDKDFVVGECHKKRGSKDDITIWMNLKECQELLELEGQINAIMALECNCASVDRLGEIRKELMAILPETKIIETESTALARAEARNQAKATAEKQISHKKKQRETLKQERESLAAVLVPLIAFGAMGVIALLTLFNVRGRITEIGVLRAIGVPGQRLLNAFIVRALIVGVVGVGAALVVVATLGHLVKDSYLHGYSQTDLVSPTIWLAILVLTPLLSCIAAWIPSLAAAQRDPAEVLRHD